MDSCLNLVGSPQYSGAAKTETTSLWTDWLSDALGQTSDETQIQMFVNWSTSHVTAVAKRWESAQVEWT